MSADAEQGFEGSVSALSVADVLQLQGGNRFSGSIVFSHRGQQAAVYMQHGDVVHAELGHLRGERVLGVVLGWPTGNFEAHANVATFARTIDKRLDHLLLDSARLIDEARRDARTAPAATPPPRAAALPASVERVLALPGVAYAAILKGAAPVGDASPEAAALAARSTALLSLLAVPLGKALGLGEVGRVALGSPRQEQLLLIHAKEMYLAVSVAPDASLAEVEPEVRRVATRQGS